MADPLDYVLVRLDDNLPDKAVLTYDASKDMITDSGLTALHGELQASADTIAVGLQNMSSAGEQVVWENQHSSVVYAPPWHVIDKINTEGSRDRIYGALQTADVFTDKSGIVENPTNVITVPENGVVFDYTIEFPEARDNIEFIINYNQPDPSAHSTQLNAWREVLDVSAGVNVINLKVPNALYTGQFYFSIHPVDLDEAPVKVVGNPQTGEFAYSTSYRAFREVPLATREYVDSAVTGGSPTGFLTKAVYDTDDDGKVNLAVAADYAAALTGVQGIGNSYYYGKDADGNVGFHELPIASGGNIFTNLNQGDIPYWDSTDSEVKPSGIRRLGTQTLMEPSGFYMGDIGIASDKHGVLLSPLGDPKAYRVLMQAITSNKDEAYIKSYGVGQEKDINIGYSQSLENPKVTFTADKDATMVSMEVRLTDAATTLNVALLDQHGEVVWKEPFFNLDVGINTLTFVTPPDINSSEVVTIQFSGEEAKVHLDGNNSVPYLKLTLLPWTEKKIATEDYVSLGIEPLENTIQDVDRRIDNVDTTVNALAKRIGEFQNYFVYRGTTPPTFPTDAVAGYFSILYGLTKTEVVTLPNPSRLHNGAMFFLRNEDVTNTVRLEAPDGVSINGGTSITLPPQTTLWLVNNNKNWLVILSGYLPTSHAALISEIKSQVSGASLGITVDDGTTNYGDLKLLKLKGITADRPTGDSIDSVTLTAATTWGTLGDASSNVRSSMVLTEPPLQAYSDPDAADTVRLRLEPGTFESVHAPGYLAYLNNPVSIIGKSYTATSHADGAIYPTDVVIDNGTYIVKDMKAKAIGIQEADQEDPNVTGGTDYLVAFRIALEGEAPADGFVEIYLAEKAEFNQPVKYLEDSNGHPFVVRRYYHLGDKMGALETVGVVNAKGLKEFTMHVVDSFDKDDINILPRDRGVSGIMVQALLPTSKSGLASLQYEVDTEQNIEFTRYYMGDEMTNIDWLSSYVMPLSEGTGGEGADFPDGLHLNNISNLMVGFVDGRMVLKDNGSNIVDFVFGKIEDATPTYAMREKVITVKVALTNKDAAFRVALVQWTGKPDEYTQEIFTSRSNGAPAFQSGWLLVDSVFIPEDIANEDHEVIHEFTVPKTAVNYAVVIYPEEEKQPTELKLKTFNVGAKDPFYFYHIHQSRKLNELHLEYDNEFYESVQDATGLYSLRYTINDAADGQAMPVGTQRKGNADIELDPTVNQIPGSAASGGEGALKFGKDGEATINTLLNIASEQAKASNHPTDFWWVTIASDGEMTEIPGSRTTFPISGGSSGMYPMTSFTLAVRAGDRLALRAKSDMPDGAYLIAVADKVPLVDVSINFKELIASTADDPFASLDLQQFDHVYTNQLTVTKDVGNVDSAVFNIDIGAQDHLVVLGAVKELPDNSIRPVKVLDWSYNNNDHNLRVSFGETVMLGRVTLGIYRD